MTIRTTVLVLLSAVVLTAAVATEPLPQDRGAPGVWQKLLRLQTTASVMHTTAHPDDEHGGVLAWLSRGLGARVSLATLTRGESGDNAIGPELFDAVGLIRTEELRRADQYYGVDRQYFATVVDYGFSKRLDEALEKWGKEAVLRDLVTIIRIDRPLVVISRFQGNARDGHGNHQAAGLLTRDAFRAAGDPNVFPEQIARGLSPWRPLKLYMGGVRADEDWTLRVDSGQYSPWLGDSYSNVARLGLAFQRSQNGGRVPRAPGPAYNYYKRLVSNVAAPDREASFFDGIDTSVTAILRMLGRPESAPVAPLLASISEHVANAVRAFTASDPGACVPALARGLDATREAIRRASADPDIVFILKVKEQQFQDAINAALGVELTAVAQRAPAGESAGPPAFGPVVPGQTFDVRATFSSPSAAAAGAELALTSAQNWLVRGAAQSTVAASPGTHGAVLTQQFSVTVPADASFSRPFFTRASIAESRYLVNDPTQLYRPAAAPPLIASARYSIDRVPVEIRQEVTRLESNVPYGDEIRELSVLPALAVNVSPSRLIVPLAHGTSPAHVRVEIINNADGISSGALRLEAPPGWSVTPSSTPFSFSRAGERTTFAFSIAVPALDAAEYSIRAIASADGKSFSEGYEVIQHRDLETRYLFRDAVIKIRGIDVKMSPDLTVGYVMGIGDEVPAAIAQLGARVQLLAEKDLADGDLQRFDAIVTGTRAYAVREDLRTANRRLLEYVRNGGNLIVLYNTQEYVPSTYAPYPGQLTARAEEVSEEDAPVRVLQPTHPVFSTPNRITAADFDGWIEQRGSKFWSEWDRAYTPMIESHDRGQEPQRGGWLWARYGKGQYTYFAYAFHRQLPYAVPGAYRLLANVLSLGKTTPADRAP
ncbi:MAG TPA: PIG-L family deacetylase [Vicinamibacterales bacterium]